ncbi:MAG: KamA family radical SAM protein [Clostridia bacterium]|nr:KamA family radical SAM protein [Clostridia bacterium]
MSWKEQLQKSIRTAPELAELLDLTPEEEARYTDLLKRYPMMITPYYLSLADLSDPDDPIRKMCIPSFDEFNPDGSPDTSGEASNTVLKGLQHKYKSTALMLSTNRCAMYCRHCFRKRLVGLSEDELSKRVDEAVKYLKEHKEVSNLLISGGDAFMNSNKIIERYLHDLTEIDHLDFIRFGSRIPVTLPERIYGDKEFLDLFEHYADKKAIYLVTQFNHPRELTEDAAKAIRAMLDRGVAVKNQTVLLRGVNDDPETLSSLLKGLTRYGIAPYYVFQCRPVSGVKDRFQVPLLKSCEIVDAAKSKQNGLGKCLRFAMSHPLGKIEILGLLPNGEMVFKFHQNKNPEDNARIFTRRISPTDTWLDPELNGI